MASLDKDSKLPLYCQLMDIIIEQVKEGELKPHDKIMSEREFCENYDVSRATVRQSINELLKEGYVYTMHGKGTFVSEQRFKQDLLKFYSFSEEMQKQNKTPTSKVLDFKVIVSDKKISKLLDVNEGEEVYSFTRLRLADNEPMMIESTYVPVKRFPGITESALNERPMYEIFTKEYDTEFTRAEESFMATSLKQHEMEILGLKEKIPSIIIERITYEKNKIIEYTKSIARGDKFKYSVVLKK